MFYDKDFLLKLDKQKNKTIYARITALTFQETPIEYIEGRVTQGSINLDGTSAVRRSCSLTIVAQDFNYSDYYWGLNTKFKLEIGVGNNIDISYPNIIWFNQGIYLITSFNTSRNTTSFNISIQGKDKMCLLNGEMGGVIESSVDFGTIEEEDKNGNWVIRKIPIQEIIKNAVHVYGREPYHNIIINDLDSYGLELLEYRLDTPLYIYREEGSPVYTNALIENENLEFYYDKTKTQPVKLSDLTVADGYLEPLITTLNANPSDLKPIYDSDGKAWYFTKIQDGQTAGYRKTDLIYAGDLIANVGESVTTVLDKIKNMLVEFEYFYNLDGQFIFQKKQSFKETMWMTNGSQIEQDLNQGVAITSAYSYEFYDGELITAFNNNPNLLNLKNDYSIWGERETISGAKIPIHLRYAIDKKPKKYTQIYIKDSDERIAQYNKKYNTTLKGQENPKTFEVGKNLDWREVIYQMALDYFKYNHLDDFELMVAEANPIDYPTGRTGYEQYYTDLQGFWRQLYYPELNSEFEDLKKEKEDIEADVEELKAYVFGKEVDFTDNLLGGVENDLICFNNFVSAGTVPGGYATATQFVDHIKTTYKDKLDLRLDMDNEIILSLLNDHYFRCKSELEVLQDKLLSLTEKCDSLQVDRDINYYTNDDDVYKNWNKFVYESPDQLNFWFDFLDTSGELQQFNVQTIGSRSKSVNDTNIKSIYFRETPQILFVESINSEDIETGFRYIQASGINSMFSCSAQGKSAKEKLDELIYQHGYCVESATVTSIPIYYLEPNTRIYLYDNDTGLNGDYIASKITIPLTYNGTMSITATKAAENIL